MPPNDQPSADPRLAPALEEEPVHRARWWPWAVAPAVLVGAGAGYWYWSGRSADAPAAPERGKGDPSARALPVVAAPARRGSIDVYLNALGTVTPRNMVVVKPRVDGQLMRVAFDEGQIVKAGGRPPRVHP